MRQSSEDGNDATHGETGGGRGSFGSYREEPNLLQGPTHSSTGAPTSRRRSLWTAIGLGVVVVVGVIAGVLVMGNRSPDSEQMLSGETVTLSAPTPTVDPIPREGGTPFLQALPSTVLAYALSEVIEEQSLLVKGALEGYRLTYTDGGDATVVVYAGQWRDSAGVEAVFEAMLASQGVAAAPAADPATDTAGTATPEPTVGPEQGVVTIDGQQVGRFLLMTREDGTATMWWTNTTVLVQVEGSVDDVRDVYAAFPL